MKFIRWMVPTPYPYFALGVPLFVLIQGYEWTNVAIALIMSCGVFISAGWVNYRKTGRDDAVPSLGASRSRAAKKWPSESRLAHHQYAAGVSSPGAGFRGYVLVFIPDNDDAWAYVPVPSAFVQGKPHIQVFSAYEAMVAQLEREGISYIPPSAYSRNLVESLEVRLAGRGLVREGVKEDFSSSRVVVALDVVEPMTRRGSRLARFDRRVPTPAEIDSIRSEKLGLALRRIPTEHRDLDFLQELPDLSALWIFGRVNTARVGAFTSLNELSLISTGDDEADLSALGALTFYEGELAGRESVLELPALRELHLGKVDRGKLDGIPPRLERLTLHGASSLKTVDLVLAAPGLRELEIQGPRRLDLGALAGLRHLRSLTLVDIPQLTGTGALASVRSLRELRLDNVGAVDDPIILESLFQVRAVVTGGALKTLEP